MGAPEPTWQLSEIRNDSGPMLIRKLLGAMPRKVPSCYDYVIYLTFGCSTPPSGDGYYTSADTATFAEIDETDIPELETATDALLVGAVSAPRVRDFIFYSADPQRFLDAAAPYGCDTRSFKSVASVVPILSGPNTVTSHLCNPKTADNKGMNAEPPIARFQMEHQPRRPGYARR
jgi:hypothetical protein